MNRSKLLLPAVYVVICGVVLLWWFGRSSSKHLQERKDEAKAAEISRQQAEAIRRRVETIPGRVGRLFLAGGDLYDSESGELVMRQWLGGDAPTKLLFNREQRKFIGEFPRRFIRYGLDGKRDAEIAGKNALAFSPGGKQAVFAKNKNVWTAEIDWQQFRLVNERQVTSIDSFYELNFAENIQLLTGKTLVVRNLNNLLRVNLETGDVKPMRIPLGDIGKRRSPDSKWVVGLQGGQFYCYDVDGGVATTIPVSRGGISDYQWLSNDRCLLLGSGKTVAVFDRLANSLAVVAALPIPCFRMGEPSPDGRFVFCIGNGCGVLVEVEKKTAERVAGGAGVSWVSDDTFAFSREVPDSSLRGTWLQKIGENERRVSPEPFLVGKTGGELLVLPGAGEILYETKSGIAKMELDGSDGSALVKLSRPAEGIIAIQDWQTE